MSDPLDLVSQEDGDMRNVQTHGEVTIPKALREKHGIGANDCVAIGESEHGNITIIPL